MINRVVLVGRLTRDVEVRKTQSGLSVASFTVACDRRGSRQDGNNQQSADFISCVAWRQSADFLGQYARKGAMIGVDGRLQSRSYDRNGQTVYVTEVVCDSVQLLESRSQSEQRAQQSSYDNGGYQNSYQQSYSQPQQSYSQPQQQNSELQDFNSSFNTEGLNISSDDLPF